MSKIICFILIFMVVLGFGLAARGQSVVVDELSNPLEADTFAELFVGIMDWILSIVGLVAVGAIVYGGFQYMISGGVDDKKKEAKDTIRNAIIGLIIVVLSFAFLTAIKEILGIAMIKAFIA